MNIAIDCRQYGNSGIGTYIREILPFILSNEKDEFILIGDNIKLKIYESSNVKILHTDIKPFSKEEFLKFPVEEINKCDIYYIPNYNIPRGIKVPILSTVHDIVFIDMPEILDNYIGLYIRKYFIKRALKLSKSVFTVSEFSKERINKKFKYSNSIVTYNGLSSFIKQYSKENILKNTEDSYLLFVGNIKKHKGLNVLLEAYSQAMNEGFNKKLYIVGNYNNFKTKDEDTIKLIEILKNNENIKFTGYLSNEELLDTIKNSDALIQPSLYEGFGIPPLEAMYLGVKSIVSDIKVFKEVYKELPVIFFENNNSKSLKRILMKTDYSNLDISIRHKIDELYSYETTANIIYSEMKKVRS